MEEVGRWIKHLNTTDKQLFDELNALKQDLSSIHDEIESLREGLEIVNEDEKKQTGV